jgi:tRNA(Arg) A34 adenosine deaminase TadA
MNINEEFLNRAIELSRQAVAKGNMPFGSLLVVNDKIVLEAENTAVTDHNPTAHAESNLVQRAIRELGADQLPEATLYASTEPCPMCAAMMYWAGIRRLVFGLSSAELEKIVGKKLCIPSRTVFEGMEQSVEVESGLLQEQARRVHEDFWKDFIKS